MAGSNICYNVYFALVWGAVDLVVPFMLVLLYQSVYTIVDGIKDGALAEKWELWLMLAAAAAMLVYTIAMRRHGPRVLVRAAVWPAWRGCSNDRFPKTLANLEQDIRDLYAKTGKLPTIVGAGWGFFLRRKGPTGVRVFTHHCKGLAKPETPDTWLAGTTIAHMNSHYKKRGVCLINHPTMDYISVGAWFANGNHGNGGSSRLALGKVLDTANVLRFDGVTFSLKSMTQKELLKSVHEDMAYPDRRTRTYVLSITINKKSALVSKDAWLQKRAVEVRGIAQGDEENAGFIPRSLEAASYWLSKDVHLRVMFFGVARDYGLGVLWTDVYNPKETHIDTHCGSTWGQFVQADNCSACCGLIESLDKWRGKTRFANANKWVPQLFPIETVTVLLLGYINFETIIELPNPLTQAELCRVTDEIVRIHKTVGGRSELRQNAEAGSRVIYLDWALRSGKYKEVYLCLRDRLQAKDGKVALHMGKHQHTASEISEWAPGLTLVGMHELLY